MKMILLQHHVTLSFLRKQESRGGGEGWIPDQVRDDMMDLAGCQIATQSVHDNYIDKSLFS